jgi:hypothetical protein
MSVTFDAVTHAYAAPDGRRLPSVTEVIRGMGLMDDRWWTPEACDRGSLVHQTLALINEGTLDLDSLDPTLAPYATAWANFLAVGVDMVLLWEQPLADLERGYAGTADAILVLRGDKTPWLVDAKTGKAQPWVGLQTAAYARPARALLDEPRMKRGVLELRDGRFTLTELTERSDERVFLAALEVYSWKQAHS